MRILYGRNRKSLVIRIGLSEEDNIWEQMIF